MSTLTNYSEIQKVTESDFFMATNVIFNSIEMTWAEFQLLNAEMHVSSSGSSYKVVDGVVYRFANHWGRVASCNWKLKGEEEYTWQVGMANLSSFVRNDNFVIN